MARYLIPKGRGPFRVTTARAGNYLVTEARGGRSALKIPCRSKADAERICEKLNKGDHNGEVTA